MTSVAKARMGVRLRRFREERGLTQAALASELGISPSYVNQLESSQRPMTTSVLLKLAGVFDADPQQFSAEVADRLVAQLRDVLTDPSVGEPVSMAEIRELAAAMPAVGRYVMELHRRYRHGRDLNETIMTRIDSGAAGSVSVPPPMAYEEVQELFYARRNYFPALDLAAEQIFAEADLVIGNAAAGITERLARRQSSGGTTLPRGCWRCPRCSTPASGPSSWPPTWPLSSWPGRSARSSPRRACPATRPACSPASASPATLPVPWCCRTGRSWTLRKPSATTSRSCKDASASAMRPSRTGSARCNAPEHAACRSSSCGSTGLATSPSDSPPPASTSPGWAAPARSGMSTRPSPIPPKSRPS